MEATATPEDIRLVVVQTEDSPTFSHVQKWVETEQTKGLNIDIQTKDNLNDAIESLNEHGCDLLAIEAKLWHENYPKDDGEYVVTTALSRREENHILVASDRPAYLPHRSVILSADKLLRRQLRRYRPDYRVMSPTAFADALGLPEPPLEGELKMAHWMEDLRASERINGYVIRRHLFEDAPIDSRRHTLMSDPREGESVRFLPSPLQGLTLIISRPGFPSNISEQIGDLESYTSWLHERELLNSVDPQIRDRVGLLVRFRQIGSLLKQAENEKDLLRSTSLLDTEGEIIDYESKIEAMIEIVGKKGHRTLLLERLIDMEDSDIAIRFMAIDWNTMLNAVTQEHEDDPRLGPARPAFLDL